MPRLLLLVCLLSVADAIRVHEVIRSGEGRVRGASLRAYLQNRLNELTFKLFELDPASDPSFEEMDDEEENVFLFQGDIALSKEQRNHLLEEFESRLAVKEGRPAPARLYSIGINLWTLFPIKWSIDDVNPPEGGIAVVKRGIGQWEESTCLTFKQSDDTTNGHLRFYANATLGCFSPIANAGFNKVSIARGCGLPAIVAHEIGHSLGLFHTQSRPDANDTVRVLWENIKKGLAYNFQPPPAAWKPTTMGIPYDVGSLMHYGRNTFAIDKNVVTIVPIDANYEETLGQRSGVAFTDAKEINAMYCDKNCLEKLPCANGGYTDPKDCSKCRCPDGLGGKLCDEVAPSAAQCGETKLNATGELQTLEVNGKATCNYRITAPKGKKIEVVLSRVAFTGINNQLGCNADYVEVKYSGDLAPVGARFCAKSIDTPRTMITERDVNAAAFVLYRSQNDEYGFLLQYSYE